LYGEYGGSRLSEISGHFFQGTQYDIAEDNVLRDKMEVKQN
jgi:hypothetical protein